MAKERKRGEGGEGTISKDVKVVSCWMLVELCSYCRMKDMLYRKQLFTFSTIENLSSAVKPRGSA